VSGQQRPGEAGNVGRRPQGAAAIETLPDRWQLHHALTADSQRPRRRAAGGPLRGAVPMPAAPLSA